MSRQAVFPEPLAPVTRYNIHSSHMTAVEIKRASDGLFSRVECFNTVRNDSFIIVRSPARVLSFDFPLCSVGPNGSKTHEADTFSTSEKFSLMGLFRP